MIGRRVTNTFGLMMSCAIGFALWAGLTMPDPESFQPSKTVVDRNGRMLRAFLTPDHMWRMPISLEQVDPEFIRMLIAQEDKRFFWHWGVDPLAVGRAALQILSAGKVISGASTITMQTVRLMDPRPRTVVAKFIEAARAMALEMRYTKSEILELYLTLAPYGGNIQGVRAASLAYFNKEPKHLLPAQSALLVALPQAPESRRPDRRVRTATRARNAILKNALDLGIISKEMYGVNIALSVPTKRHAMPFLAPHLARRLGSAQNAHVLKTTIDASLQSKLQSHAQLALQDMPEAANIAILVVDAPTGEVLSHMASADFFNSTRSGQIDLTRAIRSPGSTLKPLVYGMAIEEGILDPRSIVTDTPLRTQGYAPANFSGRYIGEVSVKHALQYSLNQPAIQVLAHVGPERLLSRLQDGGIPAHLPGAGDPPGLAIVLGGLGTTLEGLASLYTAFATDGRVRPLRYLANETHQSAKRVLHEGPAWEIRRILQSTPHPYGENINLAWKTGTSYGHRDAWAVGIIDRTVIAVWVGRPDGSPSPGHYGLNTAAPILFDAASMVEPKKMLVNPPPPKGWRPMSSYALPQTLEYFPPRPVNLSNQKTALWITWPADGSQIQLGSKSDLKLIAKGGKRPLTWLVNGKPLASPAHRREAVWSADGIGFVDISVVDADGKVSRSHVQLVVKPDESRAMAESW